MRLGSAYGRSPSMLRDEIFDEAACAITLPASLLEDSMQPAANTFAEQVSSAIQTNPYLAGRKLRFEAGDGRVVLQGKVASYFQKQMAQEALRRIEGILEIENQLEVC